MVYYVYEKLLEKSSKVLHLACNGLAHKNVVLKVSIWPVGFLQF